MSVYINMEMPKSCGKCKLFDLSHAIGLFAPLGFCRVCGKEIFCLSRIADACPLISVPEPHGDLKDVNTLIEFIENRYEITWKDDYEGGIKDACIDILEKISTMPTIIQASGTEE